VRVLNAAPARLNLTKLRFLVLSRPYISKHSISKTISRMSSQYIIKLKDDVPDSEVAKVKREIEASGGSIKHTHTLFKGFTATIPGVHAKTLESNQHIDSIEADSDVHTQ